MQANAAKAKLSFFWSLAVALVIPSPLYAGNFASTMSSGTTVSAAPGADSPYGSGFNLPKHSETPGQTGSSFVHTSRMQDGRSHYLLHSQIDAQQSPTTESKKGEAKHEQIEDSAQNSPLAPQQTPAEQAESANEDELFEAQERAEAAEEETPTSDIVPTDITKGARGQRYLKQIMQKLADTEEAGQLAEDNSWIMITCNLSPIYYGFDDAVLFGAGGTVLSAHHHRTLELRHGCLFTMTGDKTIVVATGIGNIQIPPGSAVIVEKNENGLVRLQAISGHAATIAICAESSSESTSAPKEASANISVQPGQELLLFNGQVSKDDLKASDGLERFPIAGKAAIGSGLFTIKQGFDRKLFVIQSPMFHSKLPLKMTSARHYLARVKRDVQLERNVADSANHISGKAKDSLPTALNTIDSPALRQVSYLPNGTTIANADSSLHTVVSDTATIRLNETSALQIENAGVLSLTKGEALISANKQTIARCGNYTVNISADSIVFLVANEDTVIVRNLWSASDDTAYIGKRTMPIQAGQEIIVGNDMDQVSKVLRTDKIARRKVKIFDLSQAGSVARSEISIVSVMHNSRILSRLLASGDAGDRALVEKLKKMAACLAQTTVSHGPYSVLGQP
jgi:hypothetical protein